MLQRITLLLSVVTLLGGCAFLDRYGPYTFHYDIDNHSFYVNYFARASEPLTGADAIISVMKHVSADVTHGPTPLSARLSSYTPKDVLLLGDGWCDETVLAFNMVVAAGGYPSRSVNLIHSNGVDEHTVSEVYVDGAWRIFDPDHGIYYLNGDGSVATLADLQANPSLVSYVDDPAGFDPDYMAGFYSHIAERHTPMLKVAY